MKTKKTSFPQLLILTVLTSAQRWPNVLKAMGTDTIESATGGVTLLDEHMDAMEAQLTSLQTAASGHANALSVLTTERDAAVAKAGDLSTQLLTAKNDLTKATTDLGAANSKVTDLEAQLLNRETETTTTNSAGNEGGGKKSEYTYTQKLMKNL